MQYVRLKELPSKILRKDSDKEELIVRRDFYSFRVYKKNGLQCLMMI